jgi:hypothetical protein
MYLTSIVLYTITVTSKSGSTRNHFVYCGLYWQLVRRPPRACRHIPPSSDIFGYRAVLWRYCSFFFAKEPGLLCGLLLCLNFPHTLGLELLSY